MEAGCFFPKEEINDEMAGGLRALFDVLKDKATPLTDELLTKMKKRDAELRSKEPDSTHFWKSLRFSTWPGLVRIEPKKSADEN